jgi:hypothetical protein
MSPGKPGNIILITRWVPPVAEIIPARFVLRDSQLAFLLSPPERTMLGFCNHPALQMGWEMQSPSFLLTRNETR